MRLLLIEDDVEICEMLQDFLKKEAFELDFVLDGESGLQEFSKKPYDLVLLDLMMPKLNGMEVISKIRETSTVPVMILSAKDSDLDKSLGLGLGADDYLTKPFSMTELLARIRANIRRSTQYSRIPEQQEPYLKAGDLIMNLEEHSVLRGETVIELTHKEFEILKLLMSHPNKVYTKAQLYSLVWNDAYLGDENAVNVHISRLRSKIETPSKSFRYIKTVWGIGYKLGENL